jgi:hypothetical protein
MHTFKKGTNSDQILVPLIDLNANFVDNIFYAKPEDFKTNTPCLQCSLLSLQVLKQ